MVVNIRKIRYILSRVNLSKCDSIEVVYIVVIVHFQIYKIISIKDTVFDYLNPTSIENLNPIVDSNFQENFKIVVVFLTVCIHHNEVLLHHIYMNIIIESILNSINNTKMKNFKLLLKGNYLTKNEVDIDIGLWIYVFVNEEEHIV